MTDAGREGAPSPRRRGGPPFLSEVKSDVRIVLVFFVGLPLFIWFLSDWVLKTHSWAAWSIGFSGALVAIVLPLSYLLRFFPTLLWHDFWVQSRLRRMVRLVLAGAWEFAPVIALVAAVASWTLGR